MYDVFFLPKVHTTSKLDIKKLANEGDIIGFFESFRVRSIKRPPLRLFVTCHKCDNEYSNPYNVDKLKTKRFYFLKDLDGKMTRPVGSAIFAVLNGGKFIRKKDILSSLSQYWVRPKTTMRMAMTRMTKNML